MPFYKAVITLKCRKVKKKKNDSSIANNQVKFNSKQV